MTRKKVLNKRVCMACEWVFISGVPVHKDALCPMCGGRAVTEMVVIKPGEPGYYWYVRPA